MKAFVTGGTGFIGQHVVRKLVERGYDVVALARSESSAEKLLAMGAQPAMGDITDTESMRDPMSGSDVGLPRCRLVPDRRRLDAGRNPECWRLAQSVASGT